MHVLAGATTRRSLVTELSADLIGAYLETDYKVSGDAPFTLRVGEASPALRERQACHAAAGSAYVTAWNPLGAKTDAVENAGANEELAAWLQEQGLAFETGIGEHPSGQWPGEASFLIHGLSLETAITLGEQVRQNAILWAGNDGVPELVLLR
ncbi:MAG TPA: DUF3293 domain-containing protein [Xanthomonadaceae bacterium]|nr:DUF3293 domain-containing protein [Xanthomonadaceae bacterium]